MRPVAPEPETSRRAPRSRGPRTRGRELALKYLYAVDMMGRDRVEPFEDFAAHQKERGEAEDFARSLVEGVLGSLEELDACLARLAENWTLERMAVVDRNVLRLGCHQLLHRPDIPGAVALNESVELAKRFSTDQSGSFVNGILDRVRRSREARKED